MIYRYRRKDGVLCKEPLTTPDLPKPGELLVLPGKRKTKAVILRDKDGKALTTFRKIKGKKSA